MPAIRVNGNRLVPGDTIFPKNRRPGSGAVAARGLHARLDVCPSEGVFGRASLPAFHRLMGNRASGPRRAEPHSGAANMSTRNLTVLAAALGLVTAAALWRPTTAQEPPPDSPPAGVEVMARGPVHEAYAEPTDPRPQAGPVVPKQPPDAVEELPPDQKPEGDNVEWIPGYWAWDDEQNDFLWVSGFWRECRPGPQWVPGHWQQVEGGWQWSAGFWASADQQEVEYLPAAAAVHRRGPVDARPRRADSSLRPRLLGLPRDPLLPVAARLLGRLPARTGSGSRPTTSGRRAATSSSTATGTTRWTSAACCSPRCGSAATVAGARLDATRRTTSCSRTS